MCILVHTAKVRSKVTNVRLNRAPLVFIKARKRKQKFAALQTHDTALEERRSIYHFISSKEYYYTVPTLVFFEVAE